MTATSKSMKGNIDLDEEAIDFNDADIDRNFCHHPVDVRNQRRKQPVGFDRCSAASTKASKGILPMRDQMKDDEITSQELLDELRKLRDRIPKFGSITAREKQSMIRVAHIDDHLIEAGISAAAAFDRVESAVGWTAARLREEREAASRWTAVENELRAMLDGVAAANLKRRYGIGLAILRIYGIITQLIRDTGDEHLIPYVIEMKRLSASRFGHRKRKPAKE